jgi:hypothetical protein
VKKELLVGQESWKANEFEAIGHLRHRSAQGNKARLESGLQTQSPGRLASRARAYAGTSPYRRSQALSHNKRMQRIKEEMTRLEALGADKYIGPGNQAYTRLSDTTAKIYMEQVPLCLY